MSMLSIFMKSDPNEPSSDPRPDCGLCTTDGGEVLWRGAYWRLAAVNDLNYPGYVRLIANRHVSELTWLAKPEREQLFKLSIAIEQHLRKFLKPLKFNHASLGNYTPHLHWHIVPRWSDDPCFPDSIWSEKRNPEPSPSLQERQEAARQAFAGIAALCQKTIY